MDGQTLSHKLLDQGFLPVLGSTEWLGGQPKIVEKGTPFAHDYNNGTSVVYDERGWPWIKRGPIGDVHVLHSQLRPGAYVPHSNDGGHFMVEHFHRLMMAETTRQLGENQA